MSEDEAALVEGLRSGDESSFELLVKNYSGRLFSTAIRILGNEEDAKDAVQESIISAWRGMGEFEGLSSLYTWLHRIAVNASLVRLRTARVKSEVRLGDGERPVSLAFEGLPKAWSEPGPSLEKRIAMRRSIQKALNLIPEDFRIVLILRDVEEWSSREVADRLGSLMPQFASGFTGHAPPWRNCCGRSCVKGRN